MSKQNIVICGDFDCDGVTSSAILYKTLKELNAKVKELSEELFNLRFQHTINQLDNPMRIVAVKKDIARVQTVIRELETADSQNA